MVLIFLSALFLAVGILMMGKYKQKSEKNDDSTQVPKSSSAIIDNFNSELAQTATTTQRRLDEGSYVYSKETAVSLLDIIQVEAIRGNVDKALQYSNFIPDTEMVSIVQNKYSLRMKAHARQNNSELYNLERAKLFELLSTYESSEAQEIIKRFNDIYPKEIAVGLPDDD